MRGYKYLRRELFYIDDVIASLMGCEDINDDAPHVADTVRE